MVNMPKASLDEFDLKILASVQRNARITVLDLAKEVGLSPKPCTRRLKRLEESGVISGYIALCDRESLGWGVSVFVRINLERHSGEAFDAFEKAVTEYSQVVACHMMDGDCDYMLRVICEDVEAYERFLRNSLGRLPGVARIHSNFALKRVIYRIWLPLPEIGTEK